jgi:pimeloyl-ACP methyl ester carboxylesterase
MWGLTVDVANRLTAIPAGAAAPGYPPNSGLSQKLQLAATLLSAGLGTRVVTIDWGSFDTHGDQLAGQDPQLTTLSRALAAFKADLAARGIEQNVVTLVFSEFGRRLGESDSKGTDHGSGGPIMLSGSAVKGGLAGEHPGALTAAVNHYRGLARLAMRERDRSVLIEAPVLVIWGEQDPYLGRELAEPDRRWVPNLRMERVPDAGHWLQIDRPEIVNPLLLDFLRPVEMRGSRRGVAAVTS